MQVTPSREVGWRSMLLMNSGSPRFMPTGVWQRMQKVAVGAVGDLQDGAVHGVEHRAHLGVGVGRDRPLAVVVGVAGGAGGGGGEAVLEEQRGVLFVGTERCLGTGGLSRIRRRRFVAGLLGEGGGDRALRSRRDPECAGQQYGQRR